MKYRYAVPLLALFSAPALMAQENAAQESTKNWEGELELGVLMTTGNTEETNLKGLLDFTQHLEDWRNNYQLEALYSETEDTATAERYRGSLQADYKLAGSQFWFIRGSYADDRFSGYDFQSSATTGYGNRVWQRSEDSFLDLSAGLGYRYNRLHEPAEDGSEAEDGPIARLAGEFDYRLSPTALFIQELSTEIGLEDSNTISESVTSIQSNIFSNLALKASYRIRNVSDAPADSESTDTEAAFTMLYTF